MNDESGSKPGREPTTTLTRRSALACLGATLWGTISTNIAPANGLFQYFDPNPPLPAAFYKLQTPE